MTKLFSKMALFYISRLPGIHYKAAAFYLFLFSTLLNCYVVIIIEYQAQIRIFMFVGLSICIFTLEHFISLY